MGPRPPLPWEVELYDAWAMQRLAVKPGLTGPWQVGGRSNLDFDDMVRLDLGYIAERGVMTDLRLIAQTVRVVVTGGGRSRCASHSCPPVPSPQLALLQPVFVCGR